MLLETDLNPYACVAVYHMSLKYPCNCITAKKKLKNNSAELFMINLFFINNYVHVGVCAFNNWVESTDAV